MRDQVGAVRGALKAAGVAKGGTVALVCGNSTTFVVAYLATLGVGAVDAPDAGPGRGQRRRPSQQ